MHYVYVLSTQDDILGVYSTNAKVQAAKERYILLSKRVGIEVQMTITERMVDCDY